MAHMTLISRVVQRLLLLLVLTGTFVWTIYRWPSVTLLGIYSVVFAILTLRYVRQVFFVSWRMETWNSFLVDLANTDLTSDPPLTRLRRRLSASLVILAHAALWPKNLVQFLCLRPWWRRDPGGMFLPRTTHLALLVYGQFVVGVVLFGMLPVGLLLLSRYGQADGLLNLALATVLGINLFARHTAMLVFPHDLKALLRRTVADPRVLFVVHMCVDIFAFAVLVWYISSPAGARVASIQTLHEQIVGLVSLSEWRNLVATLKPAFAAGATDPVGIVLAQLGQVSFAQAAEMTCSGFVYLNLVRMLFPWNAWRQTDEDLRVLAHGFMLTGMPDQARVYLDRIDQYDVETAHLDAAIATSTGDLKAAASKIRWAHARDALDDDTDLVFIDAVLPGLALPRSQLELNRLVEFALDAKINDALLAVSLVLAQVIGRFDLHQALAVLQARTQEAAYPLSMAMLELGSGAAENARARLAAYQAKGIMDHSAALLIGEIADGFDMPTPAPSMQQTAEALAQSVSAVELEDLPLSAQLTLVSILLMMHCALIYGGSAPVSLERATNSVLTSIREHHPSHRQYTDLLGNYARVAQEQARRLAVAGTHSAGG